MELNELQQKAEEIINKIDNKLNVKHDDNFTLIHLTEELGEIARQINNKNIRGVEQDMDNLGEEIADVLLLTTKLANNHNINLEKSILDKIEKLKVRHGFYAR